MVYVSNGQVLDSRSQSPWRLSFLVDLFWGAVEFIGLLRYFTLTWQRVETVLRHASVMAEVLQVRLVAEDGWEELTTALVPLLHQWVEEDEEGKCLHTECRRGGLAQCLFAENLKNDGDVTVLKPLFIGCRCHQQLHDVFLGIPTRRGQNGRDSSYHVIFSLCPLS